MTIISYKAPTSDDLIYILILSLLIIILNKKMKNLYNYVDKEIM